MNSVARRRLETRIPLPANVESRTIRSGGADRTYLLSVPETLTASPSVPVLFDFHGATSGASQQAVYSRLSRTAGAAGFVVVTPQGTGRITHWTPPGRPGVDDVQFVRDLLAEVGSRVAIDPARVYASGISNGAGFACALTAAIPGCLAAIAPVAGINITPVPPGAAPTSVLAFHGTADPAVPYAGGSYFAGWRARGGVGTNGRSRTVGPVRRAVQARVQARYELRRDAPQGPQALLPVEQVVADWAAHDGCAAMPIETRVGDVRRLEYPGGVAGTTVVLYAVDGGGHTWPGGPAVPRLGKTTTVIDASALIVDFFLAHPRRA
jgi:polyhydroxybutyrate depolymerase